ncbi:MAG TPA: 3-hydroxyacyl-CoA dehydrogenase [Solirubrobacteraceae bacterium]|nr:3-hydroxyacyl-CoA dehydrogenase [Solirubrobacteraceae bacterium]
MPIASVTVLGAGVLGSQIAFQTAYCGFPVVAYDISEAALVAGRERCDGLALRYEKEVSGAAGGAAQASRARIRFSADLADAVAEADLVIEAAPEQLALKRELYGQLGRVAPERTIFATNSSTLLPSAMAAFTGRPARFLALHFANQIWRHNVAEVMGHPDTDPAVFTELVAFAEDIGMVPIPVHKEQPGYVLNSLLVPLLNAALLLLVEGVADPEMVDRTWTIGTGAPAGPFAILDTIGLRTPYHIAAASNDPRFLKVAAHLKEHYLDQGKFGRESGEGFYRYT